MFPAPIAHNVVPLAGHLVDDGTRRDQRGAEVPRREPQDPRHPRALGDLHLRPGPGVHRPLDVAIVAEFDATSRPSGPPSCWTAPRACSSSDLPTPLAAAGGDVSLRRPHPGGRRPPDALALFVSGDNLRKGAALNAIQIAEALLELRF